MTSTDWHETLTSTVFVHLYIRTTPQHRLRGLGHQAASLLYSLLLPPAFQPMGLERQQPGQEVEKRETASILSSLAVDMIQS
jgi:hypothetical protein